MTTYSQRMAAKADAIAASPERIALMKRAKLEAVRKIAAIRAKHAPAGTVVRVVTDEFDNHRIYDVTRAPSGPYADLKTCDWCGDRSADWLVTSNGWTEQTCMRHAAEFFGDLFDRTGRILRFRTVLVCHEGIATEWEDMSDRGVIEWRADVDRWYKDAPVTRCVTLPDGRKAYSWTWTNDYGTDTLRVVQL